jgi:hypothetical protein
VDGTAHRTYDPVPAEVIKADAATVARPLRSPLGFRHRSSSVHGRCHSVANCHVCFLGVKSKMPVPSPAVARVELVFR